MAATLLVVVVERGGALVRPLEPAAIDAPHDLLARGAPDRQPWRPRWPPRLGGTGRHHGREALGGAIRERPQAAAPPPAGEPPPGASASPRLAFAGCLALALPLAPRA